MQNGSENAIAERIAIELYNNRREHNDIHSCQRALERYGVPLTPDESAALAKQVRENRGVFIRRKTKRLSVWAVYWPRVDAIVPVFYDCKRGQIASVLPRKELASLSPAGEE